MKKIILLVITIAIVGIWITLDRKIFFYGRNIFTYHLLPKNIYPEFRPEFEGGFAIRDEYGFSLLARSFPLSNKLANKIDENVNNILEYGYNTQSILVLLETEKNKKRYVQISSNPKSRAGLDREVFNKKTGNQKRDKYKWVNIEKGVPYYLERSHSLLQLVLFILFVYWIFFIFSKLYQAIKYFIVRK